MPRTYLEVQLAADWLVGWMDGSLQVVGSECETTSL